jgi:hypothetical protein
VLRRALVWLPLSLLMPFVLAVWVCKSRSYDNAITELTSVLMEWADPR